MYKSAIIVLICVLCCILAFCTVSENVVILSAEKKVILLGDTPPATPYSPRTVVGNMLFCSGMVGRKLETQTYGHGIEGQTTIALDNLNSVIENAVFSMENVVKATVYLTDIDNYSGMNEVYRTYFQENPPARATVGVMELVGEALVKISCIAIK